MGIVIIVDHHLGQLIRLIHTVEEATHGMILRIVAHRIESRVRTNFQELAGIVVAHGADVKLHGPILLRIPATHFPHDIKCILFLFLRRGGLSFAGASENFRNRLPRGFGKITPFQPMIG